MTDAARRVRPTSILSLFLALMLLLAACGDNGDGAAEPGDDGDDAAGDADDDDAADDEDGADEAADNGGDLPDGGGASLTVGLVGTHSMAPPMVAAAMFAEEVNLDVEVVAHPGGGEVIAALTTGAAEIGAGGIGAAAYTAHLEGLPLEFVAPQHQTFVEDYFMLSADSEEEAAELAADMSDLAGETFATNAPGVVTEWLLGDALSRGGLSLADVTVEYIPFPDQVPALSSGAIAGGIVSEPHTTAAEGEGAGYRPWETPEGEDPVIISALMYNSDWAEENPNEAEAFMWAYWQAEQYLNEHGWEDEEVLSIVADVTGLDPAGLEGTRPNFIAEDLDVDLDDVRMLQEFYIESGSLETDEPVPSEDIWNLTWRDNVLEQYGDGS